MLSEPQLESLMRECIVIARKGSGYVSPNPQVGAIIYQNGAILGKGFHTKYGEPHAEIEAIKSVKTNLKGATLIVNLEPCSHYGKTPPCVDEIIKKNISNVVIGTRDPNKLVSGKGIKKLQSKGINVIEGILKKDCLKLNESFFKFIQTNIPFVVLKCAQSLNGKIASFNGKPKWISGAKSRTLVHQLRSEYDSILVGAQTVIKDNPSLTVRLVKGRNPHKIVIDGKFRTTLNYKVYQQNDDKKTYVFVSEEAFFNLQKKVKSFEKEHIQIIPIKAKKNFRFDFIDVLRILGNEGIASILVEGGADIQSQFLEQKLADKLLLFIAPTFIGKGIDTFNFSDNSIILRNIKLYHSTFSLIGEDILFETYLKK